MEGKTRVKEKRLLFFALKPGIPKHFLTGRHSLIGFFFFFD